MLEVALARQLQQVAAGLARRAAPQPPGRALAAARLLEIPAALDQVAHPHVDAEPAAVLAGAAGILRAARGSRPAPGISARCPRSSRCARRPGRPRPCRTRRPRTAGRPSRRPRCSAPRSGAWSSDARRRTPPRRRAGRDGRPARGPASPWRSAATMASTTVGTIALQPAIGAGKRAIMMLPSGMMTLSARNEPSLTGSSGPVSAL